MAFLKYLNFKKLSLSWNKTENSTCVPILKPLNYINRKLYHKAQQLLCLTSKEMSKHKYVKDYKETNYIFQCIIDHFMIVSVFAWKRKCKIIQKVMKDKNKVLKCLFVCFKGGKGGPRDDPPPLLPDECIRICRDPQ